MIFPVGDEDSKRPSRMQQNTLNSELILSKEQLYDMFQQILSVKKFEHQLLFNALQVSIFSCFTFRESFTLCRAFTAGKAGKLEGIEFGVKLHYRGNPGTLLSTLEFTSKRVQ